jgi:hypothetical protein
MTVIAVEALHAPQAHRVLAWALRMFAYLMALAHLETLIVPVLILPLLIVAVVLVLEFAGIAVIMLTVHLNLLRRLVHHMCVCQNSQQPLSESSELLSLFLAQYSSQKLFLRKKENNNYF